MGRCTKLLALQFPKMSLISKVSLLIKPATYQPGVACLFLWSLLAFSVWGLVSDYTWETPEKVQPNNWQASQETEEMSSGKRTQVRKLTKKG